ncbi:MAG TPA: hypothetical protein VGL94_04325, partial [Ktedonobacteraceae bacterium]
ILYWAVLSQFGWFLARWFSQKKDKVEGKGNSCKMSYSCLVVALENVFLVGYYSHQGMRKDDQHR